MWVKAESSRGDGTEFRLNLDHAIAIEEYSHWFDVIFLRKNYTVKKTPEMIEAYNSLVPVKSQPVVPDDDPSAWDAVAVQDSPFRITGLGLYKMRSGELQQVCKKDPRGFEPLWLGDKKGWYYTDGRWNVNNPANDIVKLIKLDEVQP